MIVTWLLPYETKFAYLILALIKVHVFINLY